MSSRRFPRRTHLTPVLHLPHIHTYAHLHITSTLAHYTIYTYTSSQLALYTTRLNISNLFCIVDIYTSSTSTLLHIIRIHTSTHLTHPRNYLSYTRTHLTPFSTPATSTHLYTTTHHLYSCALHEHTHTKSTHTHLHILHSTLHI